MDGALKYPHILRALLARPLAIDPTSVQYAALIDMVVFRSLGGLLTEDQIQDRLSMARNGPRGGGRQTGTVAVIPIYGTIGPRFGMMPSSSGGTSLEDLGASVDSAIVDPAIDAIVLEIDSPGGSVDGVPEFAAKLRSQRGQKPIFGIANFSAGSAAYYIGAQCDQLFCSPSGTVGSIGVVGAHHDLSAAYEAAGEKVTLLVSSGAPFKTEGNSYEPLSDDAAAEFIRQADYYESMFHRDVAKGRGVPLDTVRSDFGKGRMLNADDAMAAGMIDGIDTLDGVIRLAARTAMQRQRDAATSASAFPSDLLAGPASGLPFSDRLALVSAGARGLVEHAQARVDMRAREGRAAFSDSDRDELLALADSLSAVASAAAPEPEPPTPEPVPVPPSWAPRARLQLALAQAEFGIDLKGTATT